MKRKIVLHGPSTMTVSLPSQWVKKYEIKKGDELHLEERGKELYIKIDKDNSFKSNEINIGSLKRVGKSCITSSYRQGFDEMTVYYDDPDYIETIQNILAREITGFEIIKQDNKSCTLRDLTGHSVDEFNNVLRRIWLILIDLSKEAYSALEKGDPHYKNVRLMDNSINKLSNYCIRMLVKHDKDNKNFLYYHLIRVLEKIGDHYKDLCSNQIKTDSEILELLKEVNLQLEELYYLFYKKDFERTEKLLQKIKDANMKNLKPNYAEFYLKSIRGEISDFLSIVVEMNL